MIPQVTSIQQVHYQIQIFSILECIVHVDEEGRVELGKDLALVDYRFDTALCDDPGLGHLLHCILLLGLLPLNLPHFTKSALTNAVLVLKVGLSKRYTQVTFFKNILTYLSHSPIQILF